MPDRVEPTREERIARLERMAEEYNDEAYDGPAWLRALGQLDVAKALRMERES